MRHFSSMKLISGLMYIGPCDVAEVGKLACHVQQLPSSARMHPTALSSGACVHHTVAIIGWIHVHRARCGSLAESAMWCLRCHPGSCVLDHTFRNSTMASDSHDASGVTILLTERAQAAEIARTQRAGELELPVPPP